MLAQNIRADLGLLHQLLPLWQAGLDGHVVTPQTVQAEIATDVRHVVDDLRFVCACVCVGGFACVRERVGGWVGEWVHVRRNRMHVPMMISPTLPTAVKG